MKKNLLGIIILALLVVNTVMTGIMMFTIIPANQKVLALVGDIGAAINLDLGIASSGDVASAANNVSIADISPYDIGDQLTIPLRLDPESGDNSTHYAVVGVTLSLNTKDSDYATYGANMAAQEGLIKDAINKVIGNYTLAEINTMGTEAIQQRILEELQEMYNSKFITGVSFSSWLIS